MKCEYKKDRETASLLDPDHRLILKWFEIKKTCFRTFPSLVDLAGSLTGGIVLSQILYWFSPPPGSAIPRVRVFKKGKYWLAKTRHAWWAECRITSKQADNALKNLRAKGLIETDVFKFDGSPTTHISIVWIELLRQLKQLGEGGETPPEVPTPLFSGSIKSNFPSGQYPIDPKGHVQVPETANSLTENTAENTTEEIHAADAADVGDAFFREDIVPPDVVALKNSLFPEGTFDTPTRLVQIWSIWSESIGGGYTTTEADTNAAAEILLAAKTVGYPINLLVERLQKAARSENLNSLAQVWNVLQPHIENEHRGLKEMGKSFPATGQERKVARFLSFWKLLFEEHFERVTTLNQSDLIAATRYFQNAAESSPRDPALLAQDAWTVGQTERPIGFDKYFACRRAKLMRDFFKHIEKIHSELNC